MCSVNVTISLFYWIYDAVSCKTYHDCKSHCQFIVSYKMGLIVKLVNFRDTNVLKSARLMVDKIFLF